ncbi:translocation/assembly module TamB domain-containing protein, partial [bacterium]|nr:translocation/assembly module TamB domain-containing protein [bacterium]
GTINIENPSIYATIDELGQFNFSTLATKKDKDKKTEMPPLRYLGADLHINRGRIVFRDMRNGGFLYQLDNVQLDAQAHPLQPAEFTLSLSPTQDHDTPGQFQLYGSIYPERPEFSARLHLQDWQAKRLADYPLAKRFVSCHDGLIAADLWAECRAQEWPQTLQHLSYGGTVSLDKGLIMVPQLAMQVRQIRAKAQIANGLITIKDAFANLEGVGAILNGNVYLPPRSRLDLSLSIPRLRTELIEQIIRKKLPLNGKASIAIKAEGPWNRPQLSGTIGVDRLAIQGQDLKNCQIDWSFEDKILNIAKLKGQAIGGDFQGSGFAYLDPKNPYVLFSLKAQNADLSDMSPVGGKIGRFDVNLLGSLKDPLIYGDSSGISGFSGAASPLSSVSGHFLCTKDGLMLSSGQADTSYGQVRLPYAFYDLKSAEVLAAVSTDSFALPTLQVRGFGSISGNLGGDFQIDGSLKDINSLSLYGHSRNSDVVLNDVLFSGFNGSLGLKNMNLFFPCLSGHAASGDLSLAGWVGFKSNGKNFAYSGDGNVSLLGEGVRLDQLIRIIKLKLPLNLSQPADIGANWFAEGTSKGNWARLYANAADEAAGHFAMASQAVYVDRELGALAWADSVPLGHIKITPTLYLDGGVTGQMAAGGPINDLGLAYCANLDSVPLNGLHDSTIQGMGTGSFSSGKLALRDNLFSWEYQRPKFSPKTSPVQALSGQANSWLGLEFADKLKVRNFARASLPQKGTLIVDGWYDVKQKAYDAKFSALGVDLWWLTRQPAIPQLESAAKSINLAAGFAAAHGHLKGDLKHMQLMPGTNFDMPWMLMYRNGDFDSFSGVGSIWNEPSENSFLGMIHVDPLVLSRRVFDPALPYGQQIQKYDWLNNFRQGWLYLDGLIDGPDISMAIAVDGWDLDSAMAFAPAKLNSIDEGLCTGLWHSDDLTISLNTKKPLMESLELGGTIALENGALNFKDWSIPVKDFSVTVSQHGPELALEKILFDTGMQALHGKGRRDAQGSWNADIWAQDIPLEYISSFYSDFSRLRGKGDLALHLTSPNSNFSKPTLCLGFEGKDVTLHPAHNRTELLSISQDVQDSGSEKSNALANKVFGQSSDGERTLTPEELAQKKEEERQRRLQSFIEQLSRPVSFSRFQLGRIGRTPEGELYTDPSLGLTLEKNPTSFSLDIPEDAVSLEAYTRSIDASIFRRPRQSSPTADTSAASPEKSSEKGNADQSASSAENSQPASDSATSEPQGPVTKLAASGHIDFGLDFSSGAQKWFMGPDGPDFGLDGRPFRLSVDNFTNDMLRSVLGKLPESSFFNVSGDLSMRGQWFRDSNLSQPSDSLNYLLTVKDLSFGHYDEENANKDWIGLELEDKLEVHYALQDQLGKLTVPPFHIKPHVSASEANTSGSKASKAAEKESFGEVTGEADIVLAKGSNSITPEEASFARLKVSNMPVLGMASYLTNSASFGHIDSIYLEAHGPVTSPDFDLAFQVRDGKIGKVDYSSLEGSVQGRLHDDSYMIDLGQNIDEALRLYLGNKKRQDWNVNVWGQIPLKVERQKLNYDGILIPVWEGVSYQENGELDLTANLTDKQFSTIAELVPDINKTSGTLKSDVRITGSPMEPNISGYLSLEKGFVDHDKAGQITDINVEAKFEKMSAEQLESEFQERMKAIQERRNALGQRPLIQRNNRKPSTPMALPDISRLSLEKCEALIGGKKLAANGKADVMGFIPLEAKIDISGKDLPLRWGSLFEGIVDVNAQVNANRRRRPDSSESRMTMILSGDINVKAGEVGVSLSDTSSGEGGANWKSVPLYYQLLLNMSDNVWINAYNSRVRTSGTLYIMPNETTNAPQLAGTVDISRGTLAVPFYDVRFKLRSGQLTFESSNNPVLEDVMAESEVQGYQISTFVDGSYPNINLHFSSYPQLEENEIKQLLALGTISNASVAPSNMNNEVPTIGQQQYASTTYNNNQGTAMLSRMLASPLTSSISKLLFLSDFSVDMNADNSYAIKIAKAIDPNERVLFTLTSSYDPKYNYQYNLYGVEWRAKRNLMVRIAADEKGHILPWFQGRWEF